jgi:enamine deaminase RidA (YjgF/YER057c/UK114 family)
MNAAYRNWMGGWLVGLWVACAAAIGRTSQGQEPPRAAGILVGKVEQLHSPQIFGSDIAQVLQTIDTHVMRLEGRLVKLHLVCRSDAIATQAQQLIVSRYAQQPPATTYVVGQLADASAVIGADAVIALPENTKTSVPSAAVTSAAVNSAAGKVRETSWGRVLPLGSRVYISGQAEKGADPSAAAAATLASLARTLQWLGCSLDDVVQIKAFLSPIEAAAEVRQTCAGFFGDRKVPLVLVEWKSNLPIEIELIAAAPAPIQSAAAIEYLTPPGFTASPVYCRVAKVNAAETIYVGGLWADQSLAPPQEVTNVFQQLQAKLAGLGSDLRHLAKATYYVSGEETSQQLNKLRPQYYDPSSPPAASKAVVVGVGQSERFLTLDMIAVPADSR